MFRGWGACHTPDIVGGDGDEGGRTAQGGGAAEEKSEFEE